ncbi:helix-turn-helix transcriptional regulator [Salinivibrio kushneri]|uniref:helix-turn-helix transcriptional regulator n=1 Tax=Salinivibrio kushneri TaxID=1908198 RepID=UPI0009897280|nr:helix-turn-helix transcriptional regulator [Salinivibrio kushneri]OOE71725.1 hypothetical protein BZG19_02095 [Salinivibrio kushneri]
MTFHARLLQSRLKANISQVRMAKQLKCARQTYIDMENGKREPRLSTIEALADILGVDKHWLSFGEKRPEKPQKISVDGATYVCAEAA